MDFLSAKSLELLCVEILPKAARPFFVHSFYRPSSSKVGKFEELQDVLSYLESFGREIILLFGYMPNIYDNFGFKQLISEPN